MLKKLSFEGRFECGVDELAKGKACAYVPVVISSGMGLGLAVANEQGYHPIPLHWCNGDNFDELAEHADELNLELFALDARAAAVIVCSTMHSPRALRYRRQDPSDTAEVAQP